MAINSIQFYGIDSVLKAYNNSDVAPFALFSGKTLLFKYDGWSGGEWAEPTVSEGEELLRTFLQSIYEGTTATYTLKVYEDLRDKEKIRPGTEYSCAFNFKIQEPETFSTGRKYYGTVENLTERLNRIEQSIGSSQFDGDAESGPEEKSFINTITGGLLKDNNELKEIIGICQMLFSSKKPAVMGSVTEQKVGDISSESEHENMEDIRLKKAVQEIRIVDPKFIDHLEMLANIAKRDPAQFKTFVTILETM